MLRGLVVSIRAEEDRSFNQETRNLKNFEDFLFLGESFYWVPAMVVNCFLSFR